jgi:hypothetical protein
MEEQDIILMSEKAAKLLFFRPHQNLLVSIFIEYYIDGASSRR